MDSIIEKLYYKTAEELDEKHLAVSSEKFWAVKEKFLKTFSKEQDILFDELEEQWVDEEIKQKKQMFSCGFKKGFTLCRELKE